MYNKENSAADENDQHHYSADIFPYVGPESHFPLWNMCTAVVISDVLKIPTDKQAHTVEFHCEIS